MSFDLIDPNDVVSRAIERLLDDTHPHDRVMLAGSPIADLPPHMVAAARSGAAYKGSAPALGEPALRKAIAERLAADGAVYANDQIVVTNGAMQALDVCFRALLATGDEVLCPEPRFFIHGLITRAGGGLVGFPSPEGGGFRPDWDAAHRRITSRTRLLFLNSPVNPTGYVFDEDDVAEAARLADEHDLLIVSDESYSHFVYGGHLHRCVAAEETARNRTIVIRSFSKDYAMAGWRVGYLAAPRRFVRPLAQLVEWSCLSVNRVGQQVARAALQGPQGWIDRFVRQAEVQAAAFAHDINEIPGLRCRAPSGGLNVLVGVHGDAMAFVRLLVSDAGVPAHPGDAFGAPGFFRLQFGATDAALGIAVERIAALAESSTHVLGAASPAVHSP
jgi:aspartate aminotransferase